MLLAFVLEVGLRRLQDVPGNGPYRPWTKYLKRQQTLNFSFSYKMTRKGTLRQVSGVPSPPRFCRVAKQFCRFGIWSNTQCITPVYALHITPSPLPPVTHCIECIDLYNVHIQTGKGGGKEVNLRERRGPLVYKRGRKYQHD